MSTKATRHHRETIYNSKVAARSLLNTPSMGILEPIPPGLRKSKFKEFARLYFYDHKHNDSCPTNFDGQYVNPKGLFPDSDPYNIYNHFKKFALTEYGSAVVNKMLKEKNKYKGFKIYRGSLGSTAKGASAGLDGVVFPHKFPKYEFFPVGGQKVDPMAIIFHELGHTKVFNVKKEKGIYHERDVVIQYENPVRKKNGYEMRYVYFNGSETINIISRDKKQGEWTFNAENPAELVKPGSAKAYKPGMP